MRLRDLRIPEPSVTAWMVPLVGGRVIGSPKRQHLYEIRRGLPPPREVNGRDNWNRRYWHPYQGEDIDARRPLCGPLKTATRFTARIGTHWYTVAKCETCLAIENTRGEQYPVGTAEVRNLDPWYTVVRNTANYTNPDPISGL